MKLLKDCIDQCSHFAPFVASYEGMIRKEASNFLNRLGKRISDDWNYPCSKTISFLRTKFALALVRSKKRYLEDQECIQVPCPTCMPGKMAKVLIHIPRCSDCLTDFLAYPSHNL